MSKKTDSVKGNGAGRKKKITEQKNKRKKKELTLEELALRAWHKTYENRHRRSA